MLKDQDDDLYDDEFVEEDEMISVVSILPAEFTNSSHECLDGDYYDPNQGEDFLWMTNLEAVFTRPTEDRAHLRPLHIKASLITATSPNSTNLTSSHVWPASKTWPKCDQPIALPKLTQTNLEQPGSRLNTFKISSQAHTSSFHVWATFSA
ncbi:hypothetical protein PIB30_072577 [Stylosanthes scabra]|uniref:Uncharacterized protein n=1 Tax=Stylosanthes scabra TaxID=79078 RepID=A0ABU6TPM1_9FABA|nr:hypothetical protein [Stylosanthes scabra]